MSLVLVLGGTRSGKSARAEALAAATGRPVTYVATGAPIDSEMRARIAAHRARRPADWRTLEPAAGADPLAAAAGIASDGGCALVDGLGGWIATLQHEDPAGARDAVRRAAAALAARPRRDGGGTVVVVAEHVGTGLVPADATSRRWVDLVGEATTVLSAAADRVELVVAGRAVPLPDAAAEEPLAAPGALRLHGDRMVRPGDADHAVNVLAGGPPAWLRAALDAALDAADRYPDETAACEALADLHGRATGEVVPTNGAAEALWLLGPALRPRLAAVVHPGFTETEAGLRAHGVPVVRVARDAARGFALDPAAVPDAADLVVVGHPASPSGTLDPAGALLALRRPGRVVVADEAFMDLVPGEPGSLARASLGDVVVVRSLTKALAVPGVRAGYALAAEPIADRLRAVQPPWSANALALAALAAAARRPGALRACAERAAAERADLAGRLRTIPALRTWPSHTNFVLAEVADGPAVVAALRARRIAVRPAGSFPGLGDGHLRLTARDAASNARLTDALREVA